MNDVFAVSLWKNFAAAIDMLKEIVTICPDETWQKETRIFYITFHTTIFLDYYLSQPVKNFKPLLPYSIAATDQLPAEAVDDVLPDQFYSKEELLSALTAIRDKCQQLFMQTPAENFGKRWISNDEVNMHGLCPSLVVKYSLADILLYNLRHVQHHIAQLNTLLRQKANIAAKWISQAE